MVVRKKGIVVKETINWILLVLGVVAVIMVLIFIARQGKVYFQRLVEYVTFGQAVT